MLILLQKKPKEGNVKKCFIVVAKSLTDKGFFSFSANVNV